MVKIRGGKNQKTKVVLATLTASAVLTVARPAIVSKVYAAANLFEWERQEDVDRLGGWYSSAARSADGNTIILSVADGGENGDPGEWVESPLYISTNSGASWQNVAADADPGIQNEWESADVSDNGQVMVAVSSWGNILPVEGGVDGKIVISEDGGNTWSNDSAPVDTDNWDQVVVSGDGSKIVALEASEDVLYITEDGGDNWTDTTIPDAWNLKSISISDDGDKILLGGENSNSGLTEVYLTEDDGDNWDNISPSNIVDDAVYYNNHDMSADGEKIVLSTMGWDSNHAVLVSDNGGIDWEEVTPENDGIDFLVDSAISDDGSTISVLDEQGLMYVSTDFGASWNEEDPGQAYEDENNWRAVDLNSDGTQAIVAGNENAYITDGTTPISSVNLTNPETGKPIQITTPDGTTITCSSAVKESALEVTDSDYAYPLGLVNFCFDTEEESNDVTLTFVTDLKPSEATVRKYNSTTKTYANITDASISETTLEGQNALQVTYTIVDNGPLDLDPDEGEIADPVGLGVQASLADTGTSTVAYVFIASTLLFMGIGLMNLRKPKTLK